MSRLLLPSILVASRGAAGLSPKGAGMVRGRGRGQGRQAPSMGNPDWSGEGKGPSLEDGAGWALGAEG